MTTINDIVDVDEMEREIKSGYINRRFHPEFPQLAIVGYSDKAQFDNHWTDTVKSCRGIIYDTTDGRVLARPFRKIFNYGQDDIPLLHLDEPILGAFNKWDGSLGIGYTRPDGRFAIATRGSFDSEQARHATAIVLGWNVAQLDGYTWLFEIIYPANRIVLDYGERDELVYLGSIENESGRYLPPEDWAGESFGSTLAEVIAQPPRKNAEGFVAWLDPFTAIKFKQNDYLALHRVISNLTVKEIWRQLRAGTFEAFAVALPDEFHGWAKQTSSRLLEAFEIIHDDATDALADVLAMAGGDRKSQALYMKDFVSAPMRGLVFSLLDSKDISDSIWRILEPSGAAPEVPTAQLLGTQL